MKILYDHEVFSYQQYGGIVRYFSELIRNIRRIPGCSCHTGFLFSNCTYLEHEFLPFPFGNTLWSKQLFFRINSLFFRRALIRQDYDLVHFTFYPDPGWRKRIHKPIVITVHDMTPELFPEYFPNAGKWIQNKRFWCHHADGIIAVSNHTREDLLRVYPQVDPEKVHRVYHADSLSEKYIYLDYLPEKFLLYVGGRKSYKNFPILLKAMKAFPGMHLVCTGGGPFTEDEWSMIRENGFPDRIHHFNLTDSELAGTYRKSAALVYPSLYEGFGFPVLEAFSAGTPAILSDRSCFPEIAGNAACFFNPEDEKSLIAALQKVLSDPVYRDTLVKTGKQRLSKFTWQQTALETAEIYRGLQI